MSFYTSLNGLKNAQTDLGVIAKRELDGRRQVFVQSLSGGTPVYGARVRVVARNGETLASSETDASGHASLPSLENQTRTLSPSPASRLFSSTE